MPETEKIPMKVSVSDCDGNTHTIHGVMVEIEKVEPLEGEHPFDTLGRVEALAEAYLKLDLECDMDWDALGRK